jgi:uncharacterized protein involved in exopolysaccharide biosynthesis
MLTSDSTRFGDIVRMLFQRRVLLLIGLGAGLALGSLVAVVSKPMYRAEVLVAPVEKGAGGLGQFAGQLGGLASLAGVALGGALKDDQASLAMLQSHLLSRLLIEENNLLPVLYSKKWDAQKGAWLSMDAKRIPTLWDAEQRFSRKVRRVSEDRRTGLITVTVVWSDPRLAAKWADSLVATADRLLRQRAVETSRTNIAFLQKQLDNTNLVEVRQSIYRLLEDQLKEQMLAQGGSEYAFKVLDPAVVPEKPVGPSTPILILGGSLAGLFLTSCMVLLWSGTTAPRRL